MAGGHFGSRPLNQSVSFGRQSNGGDAAKRANGGNDDDADGLHLERLRFGNGCKCLEVFDGRPDIAYRMALYTTPSAGQMSATTSTVRCVVTASAAYRVQSTRATLRIDV
jgi:hypothetical protein